MTLVYDPDPYLLYQWQEEWKDHAWENNLAASESDHWQWMIKALRIGHSGDFLVAAHIDEMRGRCHGLVKLVWPKPCRLAPGRDAVHVDYLEIAPWNRWDYPYEREYKRLGLAFMRHASQISHDLGFQGRLTLCSLPQSEEFYHGTPMEEVGFCDEPDSKLRFFELEAPVAKDFMNQFMA